MNRIEFFQRQKEILEKLFSIEWFYRVKQRKHPAYQQWALCKKIIEQGGSIKFPEQMEQLHEIGRILLNSYILVELTEGDLQQLKLGSIDLYGDETVQKKIHSRIPEPEQFEDLMIELYVGAWYKTKSHFVEPMERKGCPDLKIEIPDIDNPVFIECKHLRTLSKNRLQTVIKKANKQVKNAIKATGIPSYGVVILDVSTPIIVQQVENDNLPPTLQEIIETVRSILSGEKNRSIGAAVIVWDDTC